MLVPNYSRRLLSVAITLSFVLSPLPVSAATQGPASAPSTGPRWIYPNQTLPADVQFAPLKVGPNADVHAISRDWFLLKKTSLMMTDDTSGAGQVRSYNGPTLNDVNSQVYFRLVSGMILKETLLQMGITPLKLADLAERWDRPMARMALIPYLLMPLSIANSESSFQHFFSAPVVNDSQDKKCSTITAAKPIGTVQSKIDERRNKMEYLENNVRTATNNVEQSSTEIDSLTAKFKTMTNEFDSRNQCLESIRDRVNRGATMPTAACLAKAKAVSRLAEVHDS